MYVLYHVDHAIQLYKQSHAYYPAIQGKVLQMIIYCVCGAALVSSAYSTSFITNLIETKKFFFYRENYDKVHNCTSNPRENLIQETPPLPSQFSPNCYLPTNLNTPLWKYNYLDPNFIFFL